MDTILKNNIYWVGVADWNVRDFHGYRTPCGSTYNSYLICDEKTALIDAVKAPFAQKLIKNIKNHVDLDKIDYLIVNHAEPDHSGGVPAVMEACPNTTLVCNAKCQKALERHYDTTGWKFQIIKSGETQKIVVTYDSNGFSGNVFKTITVISNSKEKNTELYIVALINNPNIIHNN